MSVKMFVLPEPKTLCFCINLRTGSLIIGILSLIGAILNIITWVSGFGAFALSTSLEDLYHYDTSDECDEDCKEFVRLLITVIAIVVLVIESIHIIVTSLLIHGIRKEKPRLFLSFLVWQGIRLVASVILMIAFFVVLRVHIGVAFGSLIIVGLCWALSLYFLLVVHAFKMQLSREQGATPLQLIDS